MNMKGKYALMKITKKITKLNAIEDKQNKYLSILKSDILKKYNIIYKLFYIGIYGKEVYIYVFYKTNKDLSNNLKTGITDNICKDIKNRLNEIGYIDEFNDNIIIEFDSDENVKKNFHNNYYLRLL